MSFSVLLGNQQLKDNLIKSLQRGQTSHCYLISGPKGSGKRTLAGLLTAALECEQGDKPCLTCRGCRKVMASAHPDCITVDDPEKKNVSVDMVRKATADLYVRPNEGAKKIYCIPRAQDMLPAAQNALLKSLEEPPEYGVFVLLTDNPEKLLPTIRSRCRELSLSPLPEGLLREQLTERFPKASREDIAAAAGRSGGFLGQAMALLQQGSSLPPQTELFLQAMENRDTLALLHCLVPMEKWKRDPLMEILQSWLELVQGALATRNGLTSPLAGSRRLAVRSDKELMAASAALKKGIEYAGGNVSVANICGWLSWQLR